MSKLLLSLSLALVSAVAFAKPRTVPALEKLLAKRVATTRALREIREASREHNLRAWLLGGSAVTFALRAIEAEEAGDRAPFEFSNTWRPNQDLDVVVDGTAEEAALVEARLASRLPYRRADGGRVWEVRALRYPRGEKEAILPDRVATDFPRQDTDSLSQGLLEVTDPPRGERRLRDALAFTAADSRFAADLLAGRIAFLPHRDHRSTRRFLEGANPEIFSVIRYFTKVLQFGLERRPEDEAEVRRIVREFDVARDLRAPYAFEWLERNGLKMVHNALDLEAAWTLLDAVGLRPALRTLPTAAPGTLRWTLERRPLPSFPVGRGTGERAADKKIHRITHATSGITAYCSLCRSRDGRPNAFESRNGVEGEAAAVGHEGLFFRVGDHGGRATGFDITYALDPNAREEADFTMPTPDTVVLRNRNAAIRVGRAFDIEPLKYLTAIFEEARKYGTSDRLLVEAFGTTALERWVALPGAARRALAGQLAAAVDARSPHGLGSLIRDVGDWPNLATDPRLAPRLVLRGVRARDREGLAALFETWRRTGFEGRDEAEVVRALFPPDRAFPLLDASELVYLTPLVERPLFAAKLLPAYAEKLRGVVSEAWAAAFTMGMASARFPGKGRWVLDHVVDAFFVHHAHFAARLVAAAADEIAWSDAVLQLKTLLPRAHLPHVPMVLHEVLASPFWYARSDEALALLEAAVQAHDGARKPMAHLPTMLDYRPVSGKPAWGEHPALLALAERRLVEKLLEGGDNSATQQLFAPVVRAGGERMARVVRAAEAGLRRGGRQNTFRLALATAPLRDPRPDVPFRFFESPEARALARWMFDELAPDESTRQLWFGPVATDRLEADTDCVTAVGTAAQ